MQQQGTVVDESLITLQTLMGLSDRMGTHVNHQTAGLCKCLRAELTFIGLLSTMNANVRVEAANVRKGLLANGALKWLIGDVGSHVLGQITGIGKRCLTVCALKALLSIRTQLGNGRGSTLRIQDNIRLAASTTTSFNWRRF